MTLSLVIFLLLIATTVLGTPYCEVTDLGFNNTILYTAIGERYAYYLDDYIEGYNLQFSVNPSNMQGISVTQNLEVQNMIPQQFSRIEASDIHVASNGNAYFTLLTRNADGGQNVLFGSSEKSQTPSFFFNQTLHVDPNLSCYDINNFDMSLGIVSCVQTTFNPKNLKIEYSNTYFIVTQGIGGSFTQQTFNDFYLDQAPYYRQTEVMYLQNQTYFFAFTPFSMMYDGEYITETFVNFYRYVSAHSTEYPAGHLVELPPITASALGVQTLTIADMKILGDTVYLLDFSQGIFIFNIWADQIVNVQNTQLSINGYALGVDFSGPDHVFVVADNSNLYEYIVKNGTSYPYPNASYMLDLDINTIIQIDITNENIKIQAGNVMEVFARKDQFQQNYLRAINTSFNKTHLIYSDSIYAYNSSGLYNIQIQSPSLIVQPQIGDVGGQIQINAYSIEFGHRPVNCSLYLNTSYILDMKTQAMFKTGYTVELGELVADMTGIRIPLDISWEGPNIQYSVIPAQLEDSVRMIKNNNQDQEEEQQKAKQQDKSNNKTKQFNKFLSEVRYKKEHSENNQQQTSQKKMYSEYFETELDGEMYIAWIDQPRKEKMIYPGGTHLGGIKNAYTIQNGPTNFFQIFSDLEGSGYVFNCAVQESKSTAVTNCTILNRIEVSGPWTAFSTGTYMGQSIFLVAGTLTDNVVEIYDLFGNFIDQIVYSIGTSVNYIATGEDLIYIGLNSTSVDVRNFDRTSHFQTLYIINSDTVVNWPTSPTFKFQVFGLTTNPAYEYALFIQTRQGILCVDTSGQPNIYFYMDYPYQVFPLPSIYISQGCLLVVENGHSPEFNDQKITEYSLNNINSLTLNKQYPLYGYTNTDTFASKGVEVISSGTGNMYMVAYDGEAENSNVVLMVFRPGMPIIQTLKRVVNVDYAEANNQVLLSADGYSGEDNVILLYNGHLHYFRCPMETNVVIESNLDDPDLYIAQINLAVQLSSWNSTMKPQWVNNTVYLVNQGTTVSINSTFINQQGNLNKFQLPEDSKTFSFQFNDKGWFDGNVIGLQLECPVTDGECGSNFTLQNKVYLERQNILGLQNVVTTFFDYIDQQLLWVLRQTGVDIILSTYDGDYKHVKSDVYGNVLKGMQCSRIVPSYADQVDGEAVYLQYIYILCNDQNNNYMIVPLYDPYSGDHHFGLALQLHDVKQFHHIKCMDGMVLVNSDNRVQVYKPMFASQTVNLIASYDADYMQSPNLNITYFDIWNTSQSNIRKIFMLNQTNTMFSMDIDSTDYKVNYGIDTINLREQLMPYQLYILQSSQLQRFQVTHFAEWQNNTGLPHMDVQYSIILVTSNTASYYFNMLYTYNSRHPAIAFRSISPLGIINTYGSQNQIQEVQARNNFLAINYYNQILNHHTVALYTLGIGENDASIVTRQENGEPGFVGLYYMKGGQVFNNTNPPQPLRFNWVYDQQGITKLTLINPMTKQLQQFAYNSYYNFTINNPNIPELTQANLILQSDYANNLKVPVNITRQGITPHPKPKSGDDDDESSIWIWLGPLLGALVVVAIIAFIVYKRRKSQTSEYTVTNSKESEKISLQEPLKA